ncbi:MAG TPA: pyridoxal phosphate-dependent aminotransferase [Candidatus Saccharimonadales bacterium]|nr:pyridoxal phosphate-dependent aminotransferase [Candidatus Saccharimonadales bacterium]
MHYAARSSIHSPYTHAAKLSPPIRLDLRSSAVHDVSLTELPINPTGLELGSSSSYGDPLVIERLALRAQVPAESIVPTIGASLANHLALSALFDPGDEVLIEEPTYDPLLHTARLLGATIRRFPRRAENNFAIDPDDIRRAITSRTRVIALCNLHNPTSAEVDEPTLRAIGEAAEKSGARVLVDEVYREAIWGASSRHALSLGDNFLVTTSLTKAYGLGSLRCGWILAEPVLAARMRKMQDLFGSNAPHIAEQLSAIALGCIDQLETRARLVLDANRAAAVEILSPRSDLQLTIPPHGTTLAPRLLSGKVESFCELLRTKYEVGVVPGFPFEMPHHFRLGLGGDPALTRESLQRLALALDDVANH